MSIITGDIGGTSARLMAHRNSPRNSYETYATEQYSTSDYDNLTLIIDEFINNNSISNISLIIIGVAGIVKDGQPPKSTNINFSEENSKWNIHFVNDFFANGLGLIDPNCVDNAIQFKCVCHGDGKTIQNIFPNIHRIVVGPGTGLGVAFLSVTPGKDRLSVHPSEAGWLDFSSQSEIEDELVKYIKSRKSVKRIVYEYVCAGPALIDIFNFTCKKFNIDTNSQDVDNLSLSTPRSQTTYSICKQLSTLDCNLDTFINNIISPKNIDECALYAITLQMKFLKRFLSVLCVNFLPSHDVVVTRSGILKNDLVLEIFERVMDNCMASLDNAILDNICHHVNVYICLDSEICHRGCLEYGYMNGII